MSFWIPGGFLMAGAGSNLWVQNAQGISTNYGTVSNPYNLNVTAHRTRRIYRNQEVTHSGTGGMVARRRVGLDFNCQLFINWDVHNPPDLLLQDGNSVIVTLWLGASGEMASANGAFGYGAFPDGVAGKVSGVAINKRRCYWIPSALLADVETITDSTGTKVIGQTCSLEGNSWAYLLPDETGAARAWLTYQGWGALELPTDNYGVVAQ